MFFMDIENDDDREKVVFLYNQHKNLMYKTAYNILNDHALAEDAVHTSFIKIIKNLHKLNENNVAQTRNFLVTVCRNTALKMMKDKLPLSEDGIIDTGSKEANNESDVLNIVIRRETVMLIAEAIEALDPIYRDVFLLQRVHNCSRKEIADLLSIKEETVKKRLERAKQKIIADLNGRCKNEKRREFV